MLAIRECLAVLLFLTGLSGFYLAFTEGVQWSIIFAMLVCFASAYFIWPSKRRGRRQEDHSTLDIIEIIIEFPINFFIWILRFIGRLFSNKSGGLDLDL